MTVTLLTACSSGADWQPLRAIVEPNMRQYAEKWGYGFDMLNGEYGPDDWAYPMRKTQWVLDYLYAHPHTEYFWVLDIDLLLTNFTIPITDFLDDHHDIFMARDVSGHLNCGSYVIKNSPNSKMWLHTILAMREVTTSEQDAIIQLSDKLPWKDVTKELGHPSINSIAYDLYDSIGRRKHEEGQWQNGDLLVHLPGMQPLRRAEILKDYALWIIR